MSSAGHRDTRVAQPHEHSDQYCRERQKFTAIPPLRRKLFTKLLPWNQRFAVVFFDEPLQNGDKWSGARSTLNCVRRFLSASLATKLTAVVKCSWCCRDLSCPKKGHVLISFTKLEGQDPVSLLAVVESSTLAAEPISSFFTPWAEPSQRYHVRSDHGKHLQCLKLCANVMAPIYVGSHVFSRGVHGVPIHAQGTSPESLEVPFCSFECFVQRLESNFVKVWDIDPLLALIYLRRLGRISASTWYHIFSSCCSVVRVKCTNFLLREARTSVTDDHFVVCLGEGWPAAFFAV